MRPAAGPSPPKTADFDYRLPPELVARHPAPARTGARLFHLPAAGPPRHLGFRDLPSLLSPGDLLVRNVTRVIPARIHARRDTPGRGRVELLLLPAAEANGGEPGDWFPALTRPAVARGRRLLAGPGDAVRLEVGEPLGSGARAVRILSGAAGPFDLAERIGEVPLPPYLRRPPEPADRERYQTVYARDPGSVAAPTAGLHFDRATFARLRERGVRVADLVLHVGHGSFAPVRDPDPRKHRLGAEWCAIPPATRRAVRAALAEGRRVVAVGTTSVRALETPGALSPGAAPKATGLYILPGHRFRVVSAMLTNFHLPKSTLLMLVAAFAGRERVLGAYREAVREGYRFHSYGDATFLEPPPERPSSPGGGPPGRHEPQEQCPSASGGPGPPSPSGSPNSRSARTTEIPPE